VLIEWAVEALVKDKKHLLVVPSGVAQPTLPMPILRASSRTATTFLKSAPASPLMITLGSLLVDFSVCSLSGSCASVIFSLL